MTSNMIPQNINSYELFLHNNAHEERSNSRFWHENQDPNARAPSDWDNDDIIETSCLSSLSFPRQYHKLPQKYLLRLFILKLDGSCFDVHIARNSTVAELKRAIENKFSSSLSTEERQEYISWSDVWDHFCLCYKDWELINDKECIRHYGIQDGDQLRFTRHTSINYAPIGSLSKKRRESFKQYMRRSSSSGAFNVDQSEPDSSDDEENQNSKVKHLPFEDEVDEFFPESYISSCLNGWISYIRSCCGSRRGLYKVSRRGMRKIQSYNYHSLT